PNQHEDSVSENEGGSHSKERPRFLLLSRKGPKSRTPSHRLLFILVRNGFLRAVENIRNSMIKSCESPQDARLLMLLSQFGLVDELNCLFKEMLDDGVLPNLITFNTMLNFHCQLGNMVVGKVYFCGLIKSGFCCDTFTYTSLILGYCKNHELKNAYKVFEVMLEQHQTSSQTRNTLSSSSHHTQPNQHEDSVSENEGGSHSKERPRFHLLSRKGPKSRTPGHRLLFILVRNGFLRVAKNIRNSMIKSCESPQDASLVWLMS
ncbi:hypothetical protein RYX36_010474, partial [Vicia faba]